MIDEADHIYCSIINVSAVQSPQHLLCPGPASGQVPPAHLLQLGWQGGQGKAAGRGGRDGREGAGRKKKGEREDREGAAARKAHSPCGSC